MSAGCGFAPDPHLGSLQRSPDPLAGFMGPLRGRRGMEGRTRGRKRGKEGERVSWGNSALLVEG